ncbi:MAG TPA: SPOR domain-containing protein [Stellaceae bacterium]|jgi:cell division protein FtsN
MAVLAMVLGVSGAVYFQHGESPQVTDNRPTQNLAQTSATAPPRAEAPPATALTEKPQERVAAPSELTSPAPAPSAPQTAKAAPPPASPSAPQASKNLPQIQSTNTPLSPENEAQHLAQISPSATPADVAAASPRYWIEFGIYEGTYYAERLKQSLSQLGIDATVSNVSIKGRRYLRVRTAGDSDRATATAQLAKAQSALHIAPLLHRFTAVTPAIKPAAPSAPVPEAEAAPGPSGDYWVQFGASASSKMPHRCFHNFTRMIYKPPLLKEKLATLEHFI